MRGRVLGTAFCIALASCSAAPAMAQESRCVSAERILEQIEEVRPMGVHVVTFQRAEVGAVLAFLADAGVEPPEDFKPDAVIMVVGDRAGMLLFVEGDKICRTIAIPLKPAELLLRAVRGRAV